MKRRGFFGALAGLIAAPIAAKVAEDIAEQIPQEHPLDGPIQALYKNCQGGEDYEFCSISPLHTHGYCTIPVSYGMDFEKPMPTFKKVTIG